MGVRDGLGRVAAWFGFGIEDDEYYYEDEEEYRRDPYANGSREVEHSSSVRRVGRGEQAAAAGSSMGDLFGGESSGRGRYGDRHGSHNPRLRSVAAEQRQSPARVSVVEPSSFNDAQSLADRFKREQPVILNLQSVDSELSRRLVDFCSGLTYALDGNIQTVASRVFLLTPRNVEVSAEEKKRLAERAFFNQI